MIHDIWYAVRLFARRPVLFGVSAAGLALAIGISAAAWSIVRGVGFAGSGMREPDSVVRVTLAGGVFTTVTGDSPTQGNWAYSDYRQLEEAVTTLDLVASTVSDAEFHLTRNQNLGEAVRVMSVSGGYFGVLGFQAALGRTLSDDDARTALPALVVSHGFWKNRLNAEPSVVGRTVWLDDRAFTIIGVAERASLLPGTANPPAFWTTFAATEQGWTGVMPWNPAVDVLGRLGTGVARAQAHAEVGSIAAVLATKRTRPGEQPGVRLEAVDDDAGSLFITATLMAIVGLVVLLACANIAHVLLASAVVRRYEIATRLALGAGRARLMRQLLTESVLLGLLAGGPGLIAAWAATPSIARLVQVPPSFDVSVDGTAVAFVALVAVLAGIVAGFAPACHAWRHDLLTPLRADQLFDLGRLRRGRLRSLLVAGQAAVSLVLLVMAALLTRSVVQSALLDPGYDTDRLLNVSLGYPPDARRATGGPPDAVLLDAALQRVKSLPGVSAAALTAIPVFGGASAAQPMNGRLIHRNDTSAEYFDTLGLEVLRGRVYTADEVRAEAPVAVISASLAREFWPGEDPIGDTLARVWGPITDASAGRGGLLRQPPGTRVLGIVSDATVDVRQLRPLTIYLPMSESSGARLLVQAEGNARPLLPFIREVIETLDPDVRVTATVVTDGRQRAIEGPRILAALAVFVGVIALALAVIGLFGITAFAVEQRVHEIGVRRAIGATSVQLVLMLLRDNLRPVVIGVGSGLLLSVIAAQALGGALFGISRHDPLALAAAVLVLIAASTLAVLVPARRATSVNPAQLLKLG